MNDASAMAEGPRPAEPSTVAQVLNRMVEDSTGERVAVADLIGSLGPRAHGFALLLLSAPNLTPGPSVPGFSTLFAIPMCLVAAQMGLGRRQLWLPDWIMRRTMKRGFFVKMINALVAMVARLDRVLKPRWPAFTAPLVERLLGLVSLVYAVLLLLPLPFYSLLPATGAVMLSLGVLTRDGVAVASSLVMAALSIAALVAIVWFADFLLGPG